MRHTFETEQWLPFPVERVFAFFANPENLPRLMPPWQKTRIEQASFAPLPQRPASSTPSSAAAGPGTTLTLSFRPFPLAPFRLHWDAEISEFVWNDHFCDVQHRGPFAFWRHCHNVIAEPRNAIPGTLVRDHVVYEMPFGPLGEVAQRLFGTLQLRSIFNYRHRRTAELLPKAPTGVIPAKPESPY